MLAAVRAHSPIAIGDPARPRRPQGVEPRAVGRRRADPAGRARRLEGGRALGAAALRRARTFRMALDAAGLEQVRNDFAAGGAARGAARLRRHRDPCGARLPAAPVPVAAGQPARRRVRRQPREPDALPARGVRRGARGLPGGQAGVGARLGNRLGARRLGHRRHGRASRRRSRRAAARPSTCRAAACRRSRRSSSGPGYQVPYAQRVKAEVGHADDRGRPDHRGGAGGSDHRRAARPMPVSLARAHALRPALAVACRRQAGRAGAPRRSSTGARSRASSATSSPTPRSAPARPAFAQRPHARHPAPARRHRLPAAPPPTARRRCR